jgi:hypothetical protein
MGLSGRTPDMPPIRPIVPTVLSAARLVASAAGAGELSPTTVCGAHRCAMFRDRSMLQAIAEGAPASAPERRSTPCDSP